MRCRIPNRVLMQNGTKARPLGIQFNVFNRIGFTFREKVRVLLAIHAAHYPVHVLCRGPTGPSVCHPAFRRWTGYVLTGTAVCNIIPHESVNAVESTMRALKIRLNRATGATSVFPFSCHSRSRLFRLFPFPPSPQQRLHQPAEIPAGLKQPHLAHAHQHFLIERHLSSPPVQPGPSSSPPISWRLPSSRQLSSEWSASGPVTLSWLVLSPSQLWRLWPS